MIKRFARWLLRLLAEGILNVSIKDGVVKSELNLKRMVAYA